MIWFVMIPGSEIWSARTVLYPQPFAAGVMICLRIWSERFRVSDSGSPIGAITKHGFSSGILLSFLFLLCNMNESIAVSIMQCCRVDLACLLKQSESGRMGNLFAHAAISSLSRLMIYHWDLLLQHWDLLLQYWDQLLQYWDTLEIDF